MAHLLALVFMCVMAAASGVFSFSGYYGLWHREFQSEDGPILLTLTLIFLCSIDTLWVLW